MTSSRQHIAILFDPCTLCAMKESVSLKKASYKLEFDRSFLSIILESIAEYMRIIFELHPSFITFDVISCGDRIHSQTSITKDGYLNTIHRFSSIVGVSECEQVKFVEAMEQFLLELPSDFYNSHNFNSPFDSHQFPPQTHILFIARNQCGVENYEFCINKEKMTKINFSTLCKMAKTKNSSISQVHILKYGLVGSEKTEWIKTTKSAYKQSSNEQKLEDGELIEDIFEDSMQNGSDFIDFYEAITPIDSLHACLMSLVCEVQFVSLLRRCPVVNVPFKDPQTAKKTALSIPMILRTDYRDDNLVSLEWKKNESFDESHFINSKIALIAPSKLNETSRLLLKFVNKKKIATLSANYRNEKNEKISHCIKVIGKKIYLVWLKKNIQKNVVKMEKNKHLFVDWLKNQNIVNSLTQIKPPSFDQNNKMNVMQMQMSDGEMRQFVSSTFMNNVSTQLQPIALQKMSKELIATQIDENYDDSAMNLDDRNVSLLDMFWNDD